MIERGKGLGKAKLVIGWNEYVDLPAWGILGLRAKLDTGARSSALHVENIELRPHGHVRFDVMLHRKKSDRRVHIEAPISRRARVRSSSGHMELRYFVMAELRLGPVVEVVEVNLMDRQRMIYRMLLGRSALAGRFLIDVARQNLLERPRRAARRALR
ncbi:MAG: RimK/LysX family protein [Myxococcales bacterium]|nr:RimK/LysX family protein [Myxococcales bacterium]MDH5307890.1 RimK/LysX family protein [Myxococcales bacterium]MDH5566017.1 RimK/LysX family protein [Myxococcales bacterium]